LLISKFTQISGQYLDGKIAKLGKLFILLFLFLLFFPYEAYTKVILYLKNGNKLEAYGCWEKGKQICFEKYGGTVCIPANSVAKIETQKDEIDETNVRNEEVSKYTSTNEEIGISTGYQYESASTEEGYDTSLLEKISGRSSPDLDITAWRSSPDLDITDIMEIIALISGIFWFIVWAIIAFVIADDAGKRGMSKVAWWWTTFLLCLIGLVLYLCVRKPYRT